VFQNPAACGEKLVENRPKSNMPDRGWREWKRELLLYWLSPIVEVAIGIYLIVRSRNVAECLFKDEDE
jgi:hypothetical protein